MEEIRNGLAEGINVEAYAYPELSYDKMHQIRLGLKEGMDLTPFCKLGSGILRELRLSLLAKVNIIPYRRSARVLKKDWMYPFMQKQNIIGSR